LARDGDERDRVEPGVRDRGQQIRRARARRREADAGLPGRAGDPLRDEPRALLVAREHVPDPIRPVERIVDRQDRAARYAGDEPEALALEQANREFGSGESFHLRAPSSRRRTRVEGARKKKTPLGSRRRGWISCCSTRSVPRTRAIGYSYEDEYPRDEDEQRGHQAAGRVWCCRHRTDHGG